MSKKIVSLVETAFQMKRIHGAGPEFTAAQEAVHEEIDKTYAPGSTDLIEIGKSELLGPGLAVRVSKKALRPSDYCSFVLEKLPEPEKKPESGNPATEETKPAA